MFQSAHPDVTVELRQFHDDENFARDDVDLWIDVKRARSWPRGIKHEYLLGRHISPICAPAIASRLTCAADLLNETLLHHTNFPDNWVVWMREAGITDPQPALGPGFDFGNHLIVAATTGMGVAVIHPFMVRESWPAENWSSLLSWQCPLGVVTTRATATLMPKKRLSRRFCMG